ncbi:MAG: EAL domain-containing protein, partial [Micromonosporaceae bacterium]|nr:EAL domain-containing protein [Micromonosporaceae bacterium]
MTRAWWQYLLAGAASCGVYQLLPQLARDIQYDLIAASAVVAIAIGIRTYQVRCVLAWNLLCLSQIIYTLADIAWNATNYFVGEVPVPSWIDVPYLAYYPVLAAGLVLLARRRGAPGHPAVIIDVATVSIAAGVIIWSLVRPSVITSDLTLLGRAVNAAYPVGDLMLIVVALRLAIGPGTRSKPFWLLLGSLASTTAADLFYVTAMARGDFIAGGVNDVFWMAGYLLFGAAALHPAMGDLGRATSTMDTKLSWQRTALIGVAIFSMPAGLVAAIAVESSIDGIAFVGGAVAVSLLLLLRVVLGMRQLEATLERERTLRAEAVIREESQRWSERRFRSIVYASSDVLLLVGPEGLVTWCGESVERICGYLPSELIGSRLDDFIHPEESSITGYFAEALIIPGSSAWADCRIRIADGAYRVFQVTGRNLLDDPAVNGLLFTGLDVTERRELSDRLVSQAFYDDLTGLANRALMIDRTERALARYAQDGRRAAVILVGIDDFKNVNDSLGHEAGDTVLKQAAERLSEGMRGADTAARIGGDEFAILLDDAGLDQAFPAADRILRALSEPFVIESHEVYVSASAGITTTDCEYGDPSGMLRDADIAMHRAKASGKNRHQAFRPSMRVDAVKRLELHADLQRAMERGEFVVFYQPIVTLVTNRPAGFEALVRWRHPAHGILGPDRFIPLAEETGLVVPLGRRILRQACLQATDWHTRFSPDLRMAVNMSAKQVADPRFLDDVEAVVAATNMNPARLTLELTESALMADIELAAKRLKSLRAMGIKVAIDDFGTGYSSLAYLDRLPIDLIKIDRSFVAALDDPTREPMLIRVMIDLAQHLGIPVVAEGIESPTQRDRLQRMGCPMGQGYLFS